MLDPTFIFMDTEEKMARREKTVLQNGVALKFYGVIQKDTVHKIEVQISDEESVISIPDSDDNYTTTGKGPHIHQTMDSFIHYDLSAEEKCEITERNQKEIDEIRFTEADVIQQFLSHRMKRYASGADFLNKNFVDTQDDEREDESSNTTTGIDSGLQTEFIVVDRERAEIIIPLIYDEIGHAVEIVM